MSQFFTEFWEQHIPLIGSVAYKVLIAFVILAIAWFISSIVHRQICKVKKIAKFDATIIPVIASTVRYLLLLIGVLIVLDFVGVNTNSIIALLGAAGIGIALALKDTLQNIAACIMLIVTRPFKIGDFIECGSSSGTVMEINVFTTVLETPDGLYVCVPNGHVWGNTVKNYSRSGKRRLDIKIGISYDDSVDTGMQVLRQLAAEDKRFLSDPQPQIMVSSLNDSDVELMLRVWTTTNDYWPTLWDMNKTVRERIEQAGLTIPYPQQDVHIFNEQK